MSFPYLPLFVDDYEAATAHLSLVEDGIYSRLLRLCWRTPQCRLPADKEWIARKVRAVSEAERGALDAVIAEFFTTKRGYIFSKRLCAEYERIRVSVQKRKEAGKSGAAAKSRKNNDKTGSNAEALVKHPEPEPYPYIKAEAFIAREAREKPPKTGWVSPKTMVQAADLLMKEIDDGFGRTEINHQIAGEAVLLLPAVRAG